MQEDRIEDLVKRAIEKDELDLLLLGRPEYCYLPKWTPAPVTDHMALLSSYYNLIGEYPKDILSNLLLRALYRIVDSYEGLDPVASCILFEAIRCSPVDNFGRPVSRVSLGLPLEEIAGALRRSIERHKALLIHDKSDCGSQWPDGMYGDFRRLSKNTVSMGGPAFCE